MPPRKNKPKKTWFRAGLSPKFASVRQKCLFEGAVAECKAFCNSPFNFFILSNYSCMSFNTAFAIIPWPFVVGCTPSVES